VQYAIVPAWPRTRITGLMLVMSEPGIHPGMSDKDRAEHQRHVMVRMAMLPPDRVHSRGHCDSRR